MNLPTFHCQLQDSDWEMLRSYISKSEAAVCIQSIADQTLWNRKNKPTKSVSVCGKHSATFGSWNHNRQQNNLLVNLSLRFKLHSSNCIFVSRRLGQSFCNLLPWTFPLAFGLGTRLIVLSSFYHSRIVRLTCKG